MTTSTAARKEAQRILKTIDFNHLENQIRPFDKDKTKYEWPECIAWNRKQRTWYKTKRESPTVLSFGMIFLFMAVMSLFTATSETAMAFFTFFLIAMFAIPILAESLQEILITHQISGLKIARIHIHHINANRDFVIEDVISNWRTFPYNPLKRGVKSSASRNRASIEIQFKHPWVIGTPENPHIFNKIVIWGNSTYCQSLDSLAPYHIQKTDIFGVPVKTGLYDFSLKVDEKHYDPTTHVFVALSWATKETSGEYKRTESTLVETKETKIPSCPHCGLSLSDDEMEATNRFYAQEVKEQWFQSAVKAKHEEDLKDQVLRGDLKKASVKQWLDRQYKSSTLDLAKLKKLKWWHWTLIIIGILIFFYIASPGFRLFVQSLPDRFSGVPTEQPPTTTPVTTTPPITTTGEV